MHSVVLKTRVAVENAERNDIFVSIPRYQEQSCVFIAWLYWSLSKCYITSMIYDMFFGSLLL
jgi:hypothetical protein